MVRVRSSVRAALVVGGLALCLTGCKAGSVSSSPSSAPSATASSSGSSSTSSTGTTGSSGSSGSGSSGTSTGSVTLDWTAPTQNTDGTAVTSGEIAGYKIVFGESVNAMYQSVDVTDPTATSYTFQNMPSGTWYFAIVSVDAAGNESLPTNVISTTI